MKIALHHGYELSGSGSNEYTRYLAQHLARLGHEVVVVCADPAPEEYDCVDRIVTHEVSGDCRELLSRMPESGGSLIVHRLPPTPITPVFVADRPRAGVVKTFTALSDVELDTYHAIMVRALTRVLEDERPDILHANHLIYQPVVAREACAATGTPYYVVPHGSSIEYAVRDDRRYLERAGRALAEASGVVWIAREVRERVQALYPELTPVLDCRSHAVGIGTDTSVFRPLPPDARQPALDTLVARVEGGGKRPEQRLALRTALDAGRLEATREFHDAYDHRLADFDLAGRVRAFDPHDDWIIYVGALTYGKGVQSLIAAMPDIIAARPRARLLVVGAGTYREALEGLTHSLSSMNEDLFDAIVARGAGLEHGAVTGPLADLALHVSDAARRRRLFENGPRLCDRVHFTGRLDHSLLRFLLPCARLAVFPSIIREASPLVFAEAMAAGVVPLGANHSGLANGIEDILPHVPDAIGRCLAIDPNPSRRIASIAEQVAAALAALDREDPATDLRDLAVERYDWRSIAGALVSAAAIMLGRALPEQRRA